ncbi:nephrin, partial [Heptranchias perlo]|uniref:nephrin n=1 Tax=Heptranchias perlo TaxID=212740 RepID=UPI00355AAB88
MKFGLWTWPSFLLFQCVIGGSNEQRQLFRKQPENRTSIEGEVAILECEVENPSGLVQWVKDGLLLGPGRVLPGFPRYRVTGSKAAGVFNLQIEKAGLEDDASYQCQVSRSDSSLGIISNTAWLDVLIPPGVPTIQELATQGSVTWVAGEEYLLTCNVQDSKPPSTIIFKKSGVELSGSESTVTPGTKDKLFNTVSVIRVTPQSSDNRNEMLCGAVNAALTQPRFTGFTMSILFPPQMPRIEGYDHHQVKAGVTLQLVCSSSGGSPLATLQWLKGETVISRIWETDDERKTAQSVLSYPVTAQDNGLKLTCEAMNQVTSRPLRRAIVLHVVYAPSRVTIFGSTRAGENKQISLSCSTSASNPGARVRWWASGKELNITEVTYTEAADGGTITISNVTLTVTRQDNGMSIVCEAVNEAVFVTKSASVVIKVHYPPERIWIQGPPEMTPFRAGTKVTLCCFASGGIPPARLTWRKDSNPVSGGIYRSTGKLAFSELTIITVPSDNQAKYQCSAINEATTAALTTVTRITVQFAPIDVKITTSAAVVHRGQSMTLSCQTGSSNPVAQIAWIKDGVRLTGEELETQEADYGGQSSSAQITIVVSSSDNGKRVTCQAHSPILNEALNTFYTLAVLYPPEFSEGQLRVVQAMERGAAVIPIKVTANPPEVTYTWSRNGQVLVKDGPSRHHLKEGGTLEIWNLIRDDSGFYKIHLRNEEGENEALLKLDVQYSARIYSIGDPTEVDLGESVEMVCEADANPVRNKMVTWKWTGQGREIIEEDQIFMHNATKLIIEVAKRSDAGIYECGADNGIPPGATSRAQLIVRYKPELRKGVHLSKVAVLGDGMNSATLSCKAEGIPDVEFNWAKTGVSLDLSNPRYSQVTFHEGPLHTSQLTITNASAAQDYAIFTCTAQNPLGLDFFDIQLVSTSRPDSPTGLTMLSKTHNSITLEWSEGFNGGLEQSFQV